MRTPRLSTPQPHLLMIHGLLGSIDYFGPRDLLAGIDVHTPDGLGYGSRAADGPADLHGQAHAVATYLCERIGAPTWLLGHSVGGAVAMLAAERAPHLVAGLISVEGNFTLADAFWCARIAAQDSAAWEEAYRDMAGDPHGLLARAGIALAEPPNEGPSGERLAWARAILAHQSAATVHSMARSVIAVTGNPAYLDTVRAVVERTPLCLLAGERSAAGWDVPAWVRERVRAGTVPSRTLPGTGHMMMLEDPAGFCQAVRGFIEGASAQRFSAEAETR